MTQQTKHVALANSIHEHLFTEDFGVLCLTERGGFQSWYASLLSAFALLAAGEEVMYGHTSYGEPIDDVQIVVFTSTLVLTAKVDPTADGVPIANAIPRDSLVSVKLSAFGKIDAEKRQADEWPGSLNLLLTYRDFAVPIEIVAEGADRHAIYQETPVVALIEGLRSDLSRSRSRN